MRLAEQVKKVFPGFQQSRQRRRGQINGLDNLVPFAVVIIVVAIFASVGAVVLGELRSTAGEERVNTAWTGSQPANATGSPGIPNGGVTLTVPHSFVNGTETVFFQNDTAGAALENQTLGPIDGTFPDNYSVLDDTRINVTTVPQYEDGHQGQADKLFARGEYDQTSDAQNVMDKALDSLDTMADFLVVLIVTAIAAVVFILLGGMRRTARQSSV